MNKAKIIRDIYNDVFLEINLGKTKVYFEIDSYASDPNGKAIPLTKEFLINLKEE